MVKKEQLYIDDSLIHGKGLFTIADIKKNDCIILIADIDRKKKGMKWISDLGDFVNHQKNGNCILTQEGEKFYAYAIRDIKGGEEITSDYTITPPMFLKNISGYKELA